MTFRMRARRRRVIVIVTAVAIGGIAAGATAWALSASGRSEPGPAEQASAIVETGDIEAVVTGRGPLSAALTASAGFAESGTITSIRVRPGDSVAVGQELATIDPAPAQRQVARAQQARQVAAAARDAAVQQRDAARAALAAAQAAEEAARSTPTATPDPGGSGTSSPDDRARPDPATLAAAVREAQVQLANAEAALVQSEAAVADAVRDAEAAVAAEAATVLRAPIAGVVTTVRGAVGAVSSPGGTAPSASGSEGGSGGGLIDIADPSVLQVNAALAEADIAAVAVGQPARVTVTAFGEETLPAKVIAISPTPTQTDGVVRFGVRVQLEQVPPGLRLGLTALVSIVTGEARGVLTLPLEAVQLTSATEGSVTVRSGAGDSAEGTKAIVIEVGLQGTSRMEVRSGLKAGDEVLLTVAPVDEGAQVGGEFGGGFGDTGFGGGFGG